MHIGFTGTQDGMSPRQIKELYDELDRHYSKNELNILHHGDCIGADLEAHYTAWDLCWDIIIHPPKKEDKRAFCHGAILVHEPKDFLARNHDIVDYSELLIAAPKGPEELRSGTWATVRYARLVGKPITILER